MTDKMLKSFVYRDDELGTCISIDSSMKPSYLLYTLNNESLLKNLFLTELSGIENLSVHV